MKKIIITLIGIMAIMFFTGNVYAGAFSSGSVGADVTITGTNSANLDFTPSPGIVMGGTTSDIAFTVAAGNTKALDNAIVVMMTNTDPKVYQVSQDLTSVTTGVALTGVSGLAAGDTAATYKERN